MVYNDRTSSDQQQPVLESCSMFSLFIILFHFIYQYCDILYHIFLYIFLFIITSLILYMDGLQWPNKLPINNNRCLNLVLCFLYSLYYLIYQYCNTVYHIFLYIFSIHYFFINSVYGWSTMTEQAPDQQQPVLDSKKNNCPRWLNLWSTMTEQAPDQQQPVLDSKPDLSMIKNDCSYMADQQQPRSWIKTWAYLPVNYVSLNFLFLICCLLIYCL